MNWLSIWWSTLFLHSLQLVLCEQFHPPKVWENLEFKRLVNVEHVYIIESLELRVKNVDSKVNDKYFLAIPSSVLDQTSVFSVQLKDKGVFLHSGFVEQTTQLEDGTEVSYGIIQFPSPVEPNEDIAFIVSMSYNAPGVPYPEHIGISDEQQLLLNTTRYPLSAYDTKQGSTEFFGSNDFREFHPVEGYELERKEPGLTRTWRNIPAFEAGPQLRVQYSHNIPMKEVINLQRDVWVSHWAGKIQFEEYYELFNRGARLNKGFSRLEHMTDQQRIGLSHYCGVLEMQLPVDSSEHYFTDKVGMVSTYRVLGDNFYLKPRYPIFGGWKYNFTIGWTNTLSDFLRVIDEKARSYIVSIPLLNGPEDTLYDEVNLSLYLPEGAEVESIASVTPSSKKDVTAQKSYLDLNNGHVKITLNFKNLIDQVGADRLLVKYTYSKEAAYGKPLNVALCIFTALMGFFFLKSINLNVGS